jgi:23S rRNA maturation-related 3'-5' exoribonuclease YhaM
MKQVKYETTEYLDDGYRIGEIVMEDNEFYNAQISSPYFTNIDELNLLHEFLDVVEKKMIGTEE